MNITSRILENKITEANNEVLHLFCSGRAECYANKDLMEYKPGTINEIRDILAKRNALIELQSEFIDKENAGDKA